MTALQKASCLRPPGPLPLRMHASDATGLPLVLDGAFGADLIRFPPGGGVPAHTHPGRHVLVVVSGAGSVEVGGRGHRLAAGDVYLVPGGVPHAVRADAGCELTLVAVGDDRRPVDSPDRLEVLADAPEVA